MKSKKFFKLMTLVVSAGLLMGNEKCQETKVEEPKTRELKKIVEVGLITSRPIEIPGNGSFDFQFVLNQQIYPVLQTSEKFWFRYNPIFKDNQVPTAQNFDLAAMNLSSNDYDLLAKNTNRPSVVISDEVSCMVNLPQMTIHGSVNSFEMSEKYGLKVGFMNNHSTTTAGIPKLGFETEIFQLDINLGAVRPYDNKSLAFLNVSAKQTKTTVDFYIPFQNLLFEPSFYFQTPLAKVSANALKKGIEGIYAQLKKAELQNKANEWTTRVLYDHEHDVTILAGREHNVQVGDVFEIYSEKLVWTSDNGEPAIPCESRLVDNIQDKLLARIEIKDELSLGDSIAKGEVIYDSGLPKPMGSLVKIKKLAVPVKPPKQVKQ